MINTLNLNAIKYMCLGRIILWLCQFFTSLLQPAWTCLHALTYIHHLGTTSHESHLVKKLVCSTTARMKTFQLQNLVQMKAKKKCNRPLSPRMSEIFKVSISRSLSSPTSNGGHAQKRSDFTCGDLHSTPPFDLTKAVKNTHQACDRIWQGRI